MYRNATQRLSTMTVGPLVAFATTVGVSLLGIHSFDTGSDALRSALSSARSAEDLKSIAARTQRINGALYHVLTLRGAQIQDFDIGLGLQALLLECDRVAALLATWRDSQATEAQRPQVETLIESIKKYRGAIKFVSQMLDVDFVAAVSFVQPFDQYFQDMEQSINVLVQQVQAEQRADAAAALDNAATTITAVKTVGLMSVVPASVVAANMGMAAVTSLRLSRANKMLTQMTQIDALTGLGNRRCFDETLAAAWATCAANASPLTLVLTDGDNFKKFNVSQGHLAGDDCLKRVAAAVVSNLRAGTRAARYRGEEFAVVLPSVTLKSGLKFSERFRNDAESAALPHPAAGPPGIVTISLGVAICVPSIAASPDSLIAMADQGLYAAKRGGRNRIGQPIPEVSDEAARVAQ